MNRMNLFLLFVGLMNSVRSTAALTPFLFFFHSSFINYHNESLSSAESLIAVMSYVSWHLRVRPDSMF